MSKQVRIRRGTTAQHAAFTGADGEVTFDTTRKCLVVHDGVTAGGIPLAGFVLLDPGAPLSLQAVASRVSITGGDLDSDAFTVEKTARFGGPVTVDDLLFPRRLSFQQEGLVYSATVNINFGTFQQKRIDLTGNLTLTGSGMVNGLNVILRLKADASLRTLSFPAGWRWLGSAAPANIAANKVALLWLRCFGETEADVIARYLVEP